MKFWDSSALVLLFVEQPSSKTARDLYRTDPDIAVWRLTHVELLSALQRLRRNQALNDEELAGAVARVEKQWRRWHKLTDVDQVAERAERLLRIHPLSAADSLQLGAALVLAGERPKKTHVVAVDGRLYDAAVKEGFQAHRLQPI